jgi:hypothetical protein
MEQTKMKRTASVIILSLLLAGAGCQGDAAKPPATGTSGDKHMKVVVKGGSQFPATLAGGWKADKSNWGILIEKDGTISSAIIPLGLAQMRPGQVTNIETWNGGKGRFEAGTWSLVYDPKKRELQVEIVLDAFRQDMGANALEGSSTDLFTGRVSPDGKIWNAVWLSYPKYIAYVPEPRELPVDPNEPPMEELVFTKTPDPNAP